MSGSSALRKILFAEKEVGEQPFRGHQNVGVCEPLMWSAVVQDPSAVLPRSGYRLSTFCFGTSFLSLFLSKGRKEKWWFGVFLITSVYYHALKAHKVDNGLVGHQSGFYAAGMGMILTTGRLVLRSGQRATNAKLFLLCSAAMWYELGRFHMWSEYAVAYRKWMSPQRSYNLMGEYFSPSCEVEFLPYRQLK